MRRPFLLLAALTLAAQAPLPPDPPDPPGIDEEQALPAPPEKPADAAAQGEEAVVPAPPERPAEADEDEAAREAETETEAEAEAEAQTVPTPPAPPAELEDARQSEDGGGDDTGEPEAPRPLVVETTEPAEETACRARLAALEAEWEEVETLEEGRCGLSRGVRLAEAAGLELVPAATLNCRTAEALTLWLRDDVIPAAKRHLDMAPTGVMIGGSYVCRGRNGRSGARLSEHAFGNAADVGALVFDEEAVQVKLRAEDGNPKRAAFQKEIRAAACERFTTVLGPGTDLAHRNHLHLDLRQRKNDYRLCQ